MALDRVPLSVPLPQAMPAHMQTVTVGSVRGGRHCSVKRPGVVSSPEVVGADGEMANTSRGEQGPACAKQVPNAPIPDQPNGNAQVLERVPDNHPHSLGSYI